MQRKRPLINSIKSALKNKRHLSFERHECASISLFSRFRTLNGRKVKCNLATHGESRDLVDFEFPEVNFERHESNSSVFVNYRPSFEFMQFVYRVKGKRKGQDR